MPVLSIAPSKKKFLPIAIGRWLSFWDLHFLLQLALSTLCASALVFHSYLLATLLFATLTTSFFGNRFPSYRILLSLSVLLVSLLFHPSPITSLQEQTIEGVFTPKKILDDQKKGYLRLEGTLQTKQHGKNIVSPLSLSLPQKKAHFSKYQIHGAIKSIAPLRLEKANLQVHPLKENLSICSIRRSFHQRIEKWILYKTLPYEREGRLLSALFIGTKPTDNTKRSFAKNGLQHVLAISGLHFGLVVAIFSITLSWISVPRIRSIVLLLLLTLYFILLHPSPSILRAYIASSGYFLAGCFNRKLLPLNALGLGVVLGCFIDPMSEESLSFELSFLATFAILLLFKTFSSALKVDPTYPTTSPANTYAKILRKFHHAMMDNFCLTLAASTMTVPLLLTTFSQFPLLSLYWNLFVPYLIGLSMSLFAFCSLLSPLFTKLTYLGTKATCQGLKILLDLLEQPRSQGDLFLQLSPVLTINIIFFFTLFGIIFFKESNIKN